MELGAKKKERNFISFWTRSQSAGSRWHHDAGEGGDVRGGGGGARAGGGGGGETARRVAACAGPAPAPRGGAVAAGAVAAAVARGLRLPRRDGGVLHRARAVRGAGGAAAELWRLPRLQQAPQGLLAPRLVQLSIEQQLPLPLKWKKESVSWYSSLIMSEFGYHLWLVNL